jgi:ech hydrogenase subunit F
VFSARMTGLVLKSLFSRPATRRYPFVKREPFARTRGSIAIEIQRCTLCTLCAKRCPTEAIEVDRAGMTWAITRVRCIACNACVEACPAKCLSMLPQYAESVLGSLGKESSRHSFHKEAAPQAPEAQGAGEGAGEADAAASGPEPQA